MFFYTVYNTIMAGLTKTYHVYVQTEINFIAPANSYTQ